jgi:hypothetical protein
VGDGDWLDVPLDAPWRIRATDLFLQLELEYPAYTEFVVSGPFGVRARVAAEFEAPDETLGRSPLGAAVEHDVRPLGAVEETFPATVTPYTGDLRPMRGMVFNDETGQRMADSEWVILMLPGQVGNS